MAVVTQSLSRPSLRSNLRVVWAVAVKDWKHFWRYPMNALIPVTQPIFWLVPVFFMGQAFSVDGKAVGFAAYSGTSDYMSFALLGAVLSNYIMTVFWGMGFNMKQDMDGGTLEANWITPVERPLLLVGHTITSLVTTTFSGVILLVLGWLLFGFQLNGSILNAVLSVLPMLVGLYGFGFAFASLVLIMREANTMVDISSYLVQMFSGNSFPVQALPRWLMPISLAIPLTYGYDAMRGWLLGTKTLLPLGTEMVLMVVFMFVMIILGLAAFRALERRARRTGTIGTH